jgi:antimicrobial peptide system SdpB family protein
MLNELAANLGRWGRPRLRVPVWSSGVGLARTLLALGTAGTIVLTDPSILMSPLSNGIRPPTCEGISRYGAWCLAPHHLSVGRWLSVAILLVVASGWRPRITAIPHWWVAWSLTANATLQDGGDQITTVLTLVLVGICLTDSRRWHWQAVEPTETIGVRHIIARVSLALIQLQVCVLYFQASVAKLGVPEWADGTAMWYWSRHPEFGSSSLMRPVTDLLTNSPYGVALLTWGSIALEFALATAILLRQTLRFRLLAAGITFHAFIALDMGLVSFFIAMTSALLLYLLPVGHQLVWPRVVGQYVRRQYEALAVRPLVPDALRVWQTIVRSRE